MTRKSVANPGQHLTTASPSGSLAWRYWGNSGPLVVLVHGGSGSWTHWVLNIQDLLDAGFRVLAPDLPGTGDSDMPAVPFNRDRLHESTRNLAGQVVHGLRELDSSLDTRAYTLTGFSLGSIVGTSVVDIDKAHARRLVLVGTSALGLNRISPGRGLEPIDPEEDQRNALDRQGRNLRKIMLANDVSVDDLAKTLQFENVIRARVRTHYLGTSGVMLEALPRVTLPVHAIWGDSDVYAMNNFPESIGLLNRLCDLRSVQLLAGAGHWAMFERPLAFNTVLADILGSGID